MHMQADARRLTHQVQIGVGEGGEQGDGLEDARAHLAGEHVAHGAQEGGEVVLLEGQDLDGPAHSDDVGVTGLVQQEGHLSEVVAGPELEQLHLPVVLGLRALDAALLDEVEGVAWFGWRWMVGVVCMVGGERRWAGNGSLGCVCTHVHTDTNNTHPSPPPPPHTHTQRMQCTHARTHLPLPDDVLPVLVRRRGQRARQFGHLLVAQVAEQGHLAEELDAGHGLGCRGRGQGAAEGAEVEGPERAGRRGRDGGGALGVVDERQLAEAPTGAVLAHLSVVDEDLLGGGGGRRGMRRRWLGGLAGLAGLAGHTTCRHASKRACPDVRRRGPSRG